MRKGVIARRLAAIALVLLVAAGALLLRRLLITRGISWTADLASVLALIITIGGLAFTAVRKWWHGPPANSTLTVDEAVDELVRRLAMRIDQGNRDRQVHDPAPMPVRYIVSEFAESVMSTFSSGGDAECTKPATRSLSGGFDEIIDVFNRVPTRRLVITGPAGSGKSVLAAKLAGDLLNSAKPGTHLPGATSSHLHSQERLVPVVLSAASWDPGDDLLSWIASALINIDQGLSMLPRDSSESITLAQAIAASHVLPIIDGVDELPAGAWGEAISKINEAGSDRPMVVTSRPAEYQRAVESSGREISRAAVLEMLPLSVPAVRGYLREATAQATVAAWNVVFARIEAEPRGSLAAALTNPLMLWLCRTIYGSGDLDPARLADRALLSDQIAVENHLLDAFVPAIYRAKSSASGDRWTAEKAGDWLGFLASEQTTTRLPDLGWWRLNSAVRGMRTAGAAIRGACLAVLGWQLAAWVLKRQHDWRGGVYAGEVGLNKILLSGPVGLAARPSMDHFMRLLDLNTSRPFFDKVGMTFSSVMSVHSMTVFAVKCGVIILTMRIIFMAWGKSRTPVPMRIALSRLLPLLGKTLLAIAALYIVFEFTRQSPAARHLLTGAPAGLMSIALLGGMLVAHATLVTVRADIDAGVTPSGILLGDRLSAILAEARNKATLTVLLWLCCGADVATAVALFCAAGLISTVFLGGGRRWASSAFTDSRFWLAISGRMPWQVLAFMQDAAERGALSCVGSAYQFRHLRLRHRLAEEHAEGSVWQVRRGHRVGRAWIWFADQIIGIPESTAAWTYRIWSRRFDEMAMAISDYVGKGTLLGGVHAEGPGMVQRFQSADGQSWHMCALPGRAPVLVSNAIWTMLRDLRARSLEPYADSIAAVGYPALRQGVPLRRRIVPADAPAVDLAGGLLGPARLARGTTDSDWRWMPAAAIEYTTNLSGHILSRSGFDWHSRLQVALSLRPAHSDVRMTTALRDRLLVKLQGSDIARTISSVWRSAGEPPAWTPYGPHNDGKVLGWHMTATATHQERLVADIGVYVRASNLLGIYSPGELLSIQVSVSLAELRERRHSPGLQIPPGGRLGLSLIDARAVLTAAWVTAATAIAPAILAGNMTALASAPSMAVILVLPCTQEEAVRYGISHLDSTKTSMLGGRIMRLVERRASIDGPVLWTRDDDRLAYIEEMLSYLAPELGYDLPPDWATPRVASTIGDL
jgi:hypothetical protein